MEFFNSKEFFDMIPDQETREKYSGEELRFLESSELVYENDNRAELNNMFELQNRVDTQEKVTNSLLDSFAKTFSGDVSSRVSTKFLRRSISI